MKNNTIKILAGVTKDKEIYFLEIEPKSDEHDYFSMSGFTIEPITIEDAKERQRQQFEDGDYEDFWRQAVEAKRTYQGFNDWLEDVQNEEDWGDTLDNSLYNEEITIDGEEYGFLSGSCGQHEEEDLLFYSIHQKLFNNLMKAWKENHLKENPANLNLLLLEIKRHLEIKPEEQAVIEAVQFINNL